MDEYYRKYLKYKKKYLELKNNHVMKTTPASVNPIFTKIFDIQVTDIQNKELILNEVGNNQVLTNEQLIECIMIYNTTKKEDNSKKLFQLITNTLKYINHIYIIDYLNVLGNIKSKYNLINLEAAKRLFYNRLHSIVTNPDNKKNIYIVCIRDDERVKYKYLNEVRKYNLPSNLIFIETSYSDKNYIKQKYEGAIDDFIYWTLAIAFSLFTEENQINMNELIQQPQLGSKRQSQANSQIYTVEKISKKPNLILLSADTQKIYDEDIKTRAVKNLYTELTEYYIDYVYINDEKTDILKYYFKDIYRIIVHNKVSIKSYELDTNGYDLGKKCTYNDFNQYRDNTNIDTITNDIYIKNCDNFEKYMTLIKWLQYKYFKCGRRTGNYCATLDKLIERFYEGYI